MSEDRRRFLKAATALTLTPALISARPTKKARVVLVRSSGLELKKADVSRVQVRRMLRAGLCRLADTDDPRAALAKWVRPADTVGLKVNCLAGRQMSTHVELVEELVTLLAGAHLPRKQAVVFDRSNRDLERGGFPVRTSGNDYWSMGNDRGGFQKRLTVMESGASRLSVVAADMVSVLINLPIIKDHGIAGVTGALKNNFGLINNPNKFHLYGCDPHVSEVNELEPIKRKQRLVICDALRVQINGGPAYHPGGVESFRGLLFATDPVALDLVLWEIVETLRKKRGLKSLAADERKPVHILTAGQRGLGVGIREQIDLVQVKVS